MTKYYKCSDAIYKVCPEEEYYTIAYFGHGVMCIEKYIYAKILEDFVINFKEITESEYNFLYSYIEEAKNLYNEYIEKFNHIRERYDKARVQS